MTLYRSLQKIDSLSKEELDHCIQRTEIDIEHAISSSSNYPAERYAKYTVPFLKKLEAQKNKFQARLDELS